MYYHSCMGCIITNVWDVMPETETTATRAILGPCCGIRLLQLWRPGPGRMFAPLLWPLWSASFWRYQTMRRTFRIRTCWSDAWTVLVRQCDRRTHVTWISSSTPIICHPFFFAGGADGTFKVVREPFAQLLSIHAFVELDENVKQVPLLFCLMLRCTKKDYKAIFHTIQALIIEEGYGDPVIQQVVTDFEKAIWQGIRATFRAVEVRGCAFHWAQAVWWKMQDLGLATAYHEHQDVGQFLLKVFGLPFPPREHIPATFDHFSTLAGNSKCYQIVQLLGYVDETWLRSETLAAGVYTGDRSAPTTTWRAGINQRASRKPDLYQLIGHLHDKAKLVPLQVRLLLDGHVIRQQRKSTCTTQTRMYRIWDEYDRRSKGPMSLLSAIGYVYRPPYLSGCLHGHWHKLSSLHQCQRDHPAWYG